MKVDGKYDFRIADQTKRARAARERLCWLCGEKVGKYLAFVIGPMCAVNRNTSEPGCHRECAEFAAQACPFLILPKAEYRRANLPAESSGQPFALPGNPGAVCVWITKTYEPYRVDGGWLIRIGEAVEALWYCEGKSATRQQILDCFQNRLPLLTSFAKEEGAEAEAALCTMVEKAMVLLPA